MRVCAEKSASLDDGWRYYDSSRVVLRLFARDIQFSCIGDRMPS